MLHWVFNVQASWWLIKLSRFSQVYWPVCAKCLFAFIAFETVLPLIIESRSSLYILVANTWTYEYVFIVCDLLILLTVFCDEEFFLSMKSNSSFFKFCEHVFWLIRNLCLPQGHKYGPLCFLIFLFTLPYFLAYITFTFWSILTRILYGVNSIQRFKWISCKAHCKT